MDETPTSGTALEAASAAAKSFMRVCEEGLAHLGEETFTGLYLEKFMQLDPATRARFLAVGGAVNGVELRERQHECVEGLTLAASATRKGGGDVVYSSGTPIPFPVLSAGLDQSRDREILDQSRTDECPQLQRRKRLMM
jgi:hypothetical protein